MKDKLILDAGVFALLLLCMAYGLTGPLVHEIIGVLLIIGLLTHVAINKKYYKILKSGKIANMKAKFKTTLALNIILPVSLIVMIISSMVISKDIFSFMNIETSNYELWRVMHIISACIMLITSFLHLLMHIKLFISLKEKNIKGTITKDLISVFSGIAIFLTGFYIIKTSSYQILNNLNVDTKDSHNKNTIQPENKLTEDIPNTFSKLPEVTEEPKIDEFDFPELPKDSNEDKSTVTQIPEEEKLSLDEYLGKLTCTGCGRRCSLLAPQCGKGERQAQSATEEYNSLYN